MPQVYQIVSKKDSRALAQFLAQKGQILLPMVELIEEAQMAVEEFMDVLSRAALHAVFQLSAEQVAGSRHQGKAGGKIRRHGTQPGSVSLSTHRLRTRRVTNWQSGEMVLRWAAAAYLDTEKSFRKIQGYRELWMLKAVLDEGSQTEDLSFVALAKEETRVA